MKSKRAEIKMHAWSNARQSYSSPPSSSNQLNLNLNFNDWHFPYRDYFHWEPA